MLVSALLPYCPQKPGLQVTTYLHPITRTDDNNASCEVRYHSSRRFGGDARQSFRNKRGNSKRKPSLRAIKGCYVCRKDHFARDKHSPMEIREAIEKLRKEGTVYVAIEELAGVDDVRACVNDDDSDGNVTDSSDVSFEEVNSAIEKQLANASFIYGLDVSGNQSTDPLEMVSTANSIEHTPFHGIMCDTGANRSSIMSIIQYKAYCRENLSPASMTTKGIDTSVRKKIQGFGGTRMTMGQTQVKIPISGLGIIAHVTFNTVEDDCTTVLSLQDIKELGFEIYIQTNTLQYKAHVHKLEEDNGLLWLRWNPQDQVLFSECELLRLHKSFGHPSVRALSNLLRKARPKAPDVTRQLEEIAECDTCAKHATKPRRFKLTVGRKECRFNHVVAIDIMFIDGLKILHCVDEATHFQSATILSNMKSATVWKALPLVSGTVIGLFRTTLFT